MKNLTNIDYRLPKTFPTWFKKEEHLELVRFYTSHKSSTYGMWTVLTLFDPTNSETRKLESILEPLAPEGFIAREVCLCITYPIYASYSGFFMKNYMDSLGPRTHIIIEGKGSYEREDGEVLNYVTGDVLMFDDTDFGKRFHRNITTRNGEIVICWGLASAKKNWELFRDFWETKQ